MLHIKLIILSVVLLSCSKESIDDPETLQFTTSEGIKTTLDIDLEFYRADTIAGLYYINYRYYKLNKNNQWAIAAKVKGPWKVYPDQGRVPATLLALGSN